VKEDISPFNPPPFTPCEDCVRHCTQQVSDHHERVIETGEPGRNVQVRATLSHVSRGGPLCHRKAKADAWHAR
jgi:hypothetical protein